MKKHNTVKVVLIALLVFALLTWIIPAAYYSGEYVDQGRVQIGLFDLFNYPLTALSYFGYISLFILFVGGFYGILHNIPAYRSFLDKVVGLCKGKEKIAISIIVVLLAIITSICGTQFELLLFFPMLASIILLMGFDKIVVALTLVGSTMVGIAGTTYGYDNVGLLNSVLAIDLSDNILIKVIVLLVGIVLLVFNILRYISQANVASKAALKAEKKVIKTEAEKVEVQTTKKVVKKSDAGKDKKVSKTSKTSKSSKTSAKSASTAKKSTSKASRKDNKAAAKGEDVIVVKESLINDSLENFVPTVVDSKHKIWPVVAGFGLLFVIVILSVIPWNSAFGLEAFTKASSAVSEFELFGFPLFGKLLGTFNAFGEWTVTDFFFVMAVIIILLAIIYKVKLNDIFDGFAKGAKKALTPAFVVILVYTILVITTYHPFQLPIYKFILGITKGFNIVTTTISTMFAALFNVDVAYAMQAIVPYFAGVITNADVYPVAGILFQSVYGLTMLVAPTSAILVVVLSYLGISFKEWFKAIWKLLIEFLVVLLIIFTILILV